MITDDSLIYCDHDDRSFLHRRFLALIRLHELLLSVNRNLIVIGKIRFFLYMRFYIILRSSGKGSHKSSFSRRAANEWSVKQTKKEMNRRLLCACSDEKCPVTRAPHLLAGSPYTEKNK